MPGWLVDALQIAYNRKLYLLYATDVRGVNTWLGQVSSLINLHNLLNRNSRPPADSSISSSSSSSSSVNYTALLLHVAGVLSTNQLNAINRQGMLFSKNVLQRCTFENVKRKLTGVSDVDNLSNFISLALTCLPQKSGTNYFDLLTR